MHWDNHYAFLSTLLLFGAVFYPVLYWAAKREAAARRKRKKERDGER